MIVYINGRFLSHLVSGVQRYGWEVIKALDHVVEQSVYSDLTFILICPLIKVQSLDLKHIKIIHRGIFRGNIWEQVELPLYTRGSLLINLCNTYPIIKSKQMTTIHDASVFSVPESYSRAFRIWYKLLLKISKYRNKAILTVSFFSKREIQKFGAIPEKKIHVAYEGHQHMRNVEIENQILVKHKLKPNEFILAVSSLNPNKNFANLIKAIHNLNDFGIEVVIAGGVNPRIYATNLIENDLRVKYVGYVTDSELKTLYQNAYCFVFPSFNEGFGLPPLEAMGLGCPVIVSNRTSLPEICGDAALYCEPDDPDDIADKINSLVSNPQLREEMKIRGIEHSKLFSWESCARKLINVVRG